MHLLCKICAAVQPVNTADYEDEDPRTQNIRRSFRSDHAVSCGDGSVSLILQSVEATYVDPELWPRYLAAAQPPADVLLGGDGLFTRTIQRDGVTHNVRVCEDCWSTIPRYADFPAGLISPESDGDGGTVPKWRPDTVETESPERAEGVRHLWKVVCLPCYLAAFQRVYPDATLPEMRSDIIGDGAPVEPPPPVEADTIGRVTVSRFAAR